MKQSSKFKTYVRQSYGIFYIIPVMIMISSIDLTEFSHNDQQYL